MNELDRLLTVLEAMRRRWLRGRALRVVARVAGLLAALLLVAHGLVRVLALTGAPLVLVVAAALVTTAVVATSAAWPLVRRPSDRDVARFVEERWSDSEQRLVSAIDARPTALKPLLVREAATLVEQLDPDIVFPIEPRRRAVRWAMAACAALAASLVATNDTTVRAGRTAWFALRPAAFELHVQPGHARVVTGEPLTLAATLGGVPRGVEPPAVEVQIKGAGVDAMHTMERDGARYRLRLPRITSGFEYQVIAGAVSSEKYRVQMLHRPRVARVDVSYEYPPFTGLPPRREEDTGDVYAPLGTRITLHVRANKPLQSATLVRTDSDARQPMRTDGGRLAETGFTLEGHGAYRIALNDVDGLKSPGETEYFLRVMDDRPPEVRVSRPAGDRTATRLEEVRIEARADDDHGVDRLELVYSVGGGTERRVRLGSGGRSVAGAHTLYLEDLDVQPGDFITYYARAFDVGRGKKPTEARSDMFFVEVRPFAEEFVAAQSQAMALVGGGGGQDALAAAQKDIIIATWKLERRSGAGRSVEDIRALARAQGELRDRATQQAGVAAALARRDAGAGEPRQADKPPIVLAAEAMGRAASALGSLRTSAALPHEMEALNQLLRMDAEAQQRQVSRQRGGSGSGRRTGTEDLSALFDRELMREQTTNYEQQTTTEQRPERQGTSALDRIRELARRQDELARTQQELARNQARLGDEEFKRRLERLTREQEELLRQVQRVAQEMAASNEAQGQSSSQGGRTGQGGRAGDESSQQRERDGSQRAGTSADRLRRAADEMRGATSDLQRADPAQAANRSQRTLERLREAERLASGLSAGGDQKDGDTRRLAESLESARALRERAADLEARIAKAERALREAEAGSAGRDGRDRRGSAASKDPKRGESGQDAREQQQGTQPGQPQGTGGTGPQGDRGSAESDLAKLRDEYQRLQRESQQMIGQTLEQNPGLGEGSTPEGQEFSRSAPGTEAFKQDHGRWDVLKLGVTDALEQLELSLAERLAEREASGRVNSGSDERGPDKYNESLARYYEALAKKKRKSGTDE